MIVVCIIGEVETWDDYTEQSYISNDEYKSEKIQINDTTILVTRRTERQHPVEALNKFSLSSICKQKMLNFSEISSIILYPRRMLKYHPIQISDEYNLRNPH
jgi:hypothetical protein